MDFFINFFWNMPAWAQIVILSSMPIFELRASIPFAIFCLKDKTGISNIEIFFFAIFGNFLPNVFLLLLLPEFTKWTKKHWKWMHAKLITLFKKTRKEHTKKFNKVGAIMLILLVGIPFPGSGSWTASVVAWVFGVSYKRSLIMIFFGIVVASIIVFIGSDLFRSYFEIDYCKIQN